MFRILVVLLFMLSRPSFSQPVITAHRGASGYAPENTVSAVKKALEIGVDRIEVDVQQTADGVVVCLHDKTMNRTTDSKGKVGKKTWAELQNVNANHGFEKAYPTEGIPSLEQVFELMDGSVELVIEIKAGNGTYPGIEDNVVALIRKFKSEKWALVHSFNDGVLEHIRQHHPDIRLQKLLVSLSGGLMLDFSLHRASLSDYGYVEAFGISLSGTSKPLVDEVHALGKQIHVWTVNKEDDMQRMIDIGVDGLISNYPDRAKALIGRK